MHAAIRFVVEYKLYQWVAQQNCQRGLAPSNLQMSRAALSFVPRGSPPLARCKMNYFLRQGDPRTLRRWLASFRRRWGGRFGKMQVRPRMPVEELKDKARCCGKITVLMRKRGAVFGANFGAKFLAPKTAPRSSAEGVG